MKLSEQKCKNASREKDGSRIWDGGGLYLELHKNGAKYWRMKYRFLGKEKRLAFGVYPTIKLKEARNKKNEAKKLLAKSIDPSKAKQKQKRKIELENSNTFEIIAKEWHAHNKPQWKETHAATILKRLEKDIFPSIGNMPIKEITHSMLLDMAQIIRQRGANELAKRVIQMSSHIFQYAIITDRAKQNIAADLKGIIKPAKKGHYAALEAKDLPEFLHMLYSNEARLHLQTKLAVEFLMLTFVRTNEMIKAEWNEFDFDDKQWLIPAKRMKMRKDHIVPLSQQAIEILEKLQNLHSHPKYVFPSRHNRNNHMSNNTILMALRRMGYQGKMTGHGFRALAMSTIMEKLDYRHEIVDVQLAHAKRGDVAKAYDRAKFLEQRIIMMQRWADYLDQVAQGGKVIQAKFGAGNK